MMLKQQVNDICHAVLVVNNQQSVATELVFNSYNVMLIPASYFHAS